MSRRHQKTLKRNQVNVRLSDTGRSLLEALQEYHGLSQSGVLEMLLRRHAQEGLTPR